MDTQDKIFNTDVLMEQARESNVALYTAFISHNTFDCSAAHQYMVKSHIHKAGVSVKITMNLLTNVYSDQYASITDVEVLLCFCPSCYQLYKKDEEFSRQQTMLGPGVVRHT